MSKTTRITITVPTADLVNLDNLAFHLNCSRSALVSELLSQSLPALSSIASCLPAAGQPLAVSDVRRLRGESARIIGEQVSLLITGAAND